MAVEEEHINSVTSYSPLQLTNPNKKVQQT